MKKTSIIYTCFNPNRVLAQISMATLANIRRYTEPDEYELIVIDCVPKAEMLDDYGALKLGSDGHHVKTETDPGYCEAMNMGAKLATGDYLCFVENDIFLFEDWLPNLRYYLDNDLADVIIPDQVPRTREEMLKFRKMTFEEAMSPGIQEQGLMMIKKEIFEKTGGWDGRFREVYGWAAFKVRLTKLSPSPRIFTTLKVQMSHIAGLTYFFSAEGDSQRFDKATSVEAKILKDYNG